MKVCFALLQAAMAVSVWLAKCQWDVARSLLWPPLLFCTDRAPASKPSPLGLSFHTEGEKQQAFINLSPIEHWSWTMTCWFVRPLEWGDPEAGCLSQWEVIVLQTLSLARSLAAAAVGDWTESRRQAGN